MQIIMPQSLVTVSLPLKVCGLLADISGWIGAELADRSSDGSSRSRGDRSLTPQRRHSRSERLPR